MTEELSDQNAETISSTEVPQQPLDETTSQVIDLIREVCTAGAFQVEPVLRQAEGHYLQVELVGDDAGRIFGRHGRMLDALQYIINLMLAQRFGGSVRVLLDADGYRERRRELLESLARKYAQMVKDRQQECEFDPLPPHERRIIHRLFMNDPDITTYSEGEEPDRKVILAPRPKSD